MFDIIQKYNNGSTHIGWGFDKHEEDLFFKKTPTNDATTVLARIKRVNSGFCSWYSLCIVTDKHIVAMENKVFVSRTNKYIYAWDLFGCVQNRDNNCGFTFYGLGDTIPGIQVVAKVMAVTLNIMLSYRVGNIGGYRFHPLDATGVDIMRKEWSEKKYLDPEPDAFKLTENHFDMLASGRIINDVIMYDMLSRADFPKHILVNNGDVVEFDNVNQPV